MKRLLVVGTSHAGALKIAHDAEPSVLSDGFDVDFFALPIPSFVRAQIRRNGEFALVDKGPHVARFKKTAMKLNGRTGVQLRDYDHVVVVGLGSIAPEYLNLAQEVSIDGLRETEGEFRLSLPAHHAFVTDMLERSWRRFDTTRAPDVAFWQVAPPRPSGSTTAPDGVTKDERLRDVLDDMLEANHRIAQEKGLRPIPQPKETITSSGQTHARFATGARRLSGEVRPDDFTHMNGEYGAHVLREISRHLRQR